MADEELHETTADNQKDLAVRDLTSTAADETASKPPKMSSTRLLLRGPVRR